MDCGKNSKSKDKVMTAKEVSAYLKLPMTTVYHMVATGKLYAVKCGRQWRFFESDILNYLRGIVPRVPEKESAEKRAHPRIKSAVAAALRGMLPATVNFRLAGLIRDISEDGVFFSANSEAMAAGRESVPGFERDHPVEITFGLNEPVPGTLTLKGRVVRHVGGGGQGFGIKFRCLSEADQDMIRAYVG